MIETNALTIEEKTEILKANSNIDDLKYWFENNEYEGNHFEAFVEYLYENDEDYLFSYIVDHIAEKNNDEEFVDICKELDIVLEGKARVIADFYESHSWNEDVEDFVDCTIRFTDDEEEKDVTIALKSMDELGYKEGDSNDDEIFFYCDSLEDFFNLCDEDDVYEDFVVIDITYYHSNVA